MVARTISRKAPGIIGFDGEFLRPKVMVRTHQHQEVELNFVTHGSMRYLVGGQPRNVPAQRLSVLWGAAPHQVVHVEEATTFYWFTIPFSWLLQWTMPRGLLDALFRGELIVSRSPDPLDEISCERWLTDLKTRVPERLRIVQLEMEARLRRLALAGDAAKARRSAPATAPTSVHLMVEAIARRYTENLGVSDIATVANLHPNYAMSLFKKTFGMSILEYLTQHRLFHARRLLATTDAKIADIAFASGFGSLNRFYVAFRNSHDCSPKEYRRRFA